MAQMSQAEILNDVLNVVYKKCVSGFFLTETLYDGTADNLNVIRQMEVNNKMTDKCRVRIRLTNQYVYFNLEFDYENDKDLLGMDFLYETFLDKFSEAIRNDNNIVYNLMLSCYSVSDGFTYKIEAYNPIFSGRDGSTLRFVFDINNFLFGREEIDYSDIDKEFEIDAQIAMDEYEQECMRTNPDSFV